MKSSVNSNSSIPVKRGRVKKRGFHSEEVESTIEILHAPNTPATIRDSIYFSIFWNNDLRMLERFFDLASPLRINLNETANFIRRNHLDTAQILRDTSELVHFLNLHFQMEKEKPFDHVLHIHKHGLDFPAILSDARKMCDRFGWELNGEKQQAFRIAIEMHIKNIDSDSFIQTISNLHFATIQNPVVDTQFVRDYVSKLNGSFKPDRSCSSSPSNRTSDYPTPSL